MCLQVRTDRRCSAFSCRASLARRVSFCWTCALSKPPSSTSLCSLSNPLPLPLLDCLILSSAIFIIPHPQTTKTLHFFIYCISFSAVSITLLHGSFFGSRKFVDVKILGQPCKTLILWHSWFNQYVQREIMYNSVCLNSKNFSFCITGIRSGQWTTSLFSIIHYGFY